MNQGRGGIRGSHWVMDSEPTGLGSEKAQRSEISQPSLSDDASLSEGNTGKTFLLRPGAPEKATILWDWSEGGRGGC